MTDTQIEVLLQQIEEEMQDNLEGVLHLPAAEFSTEALQELHQEWKERHTDFDKRQQLFQYVGFSAFIFFTLSCAAFFTGYVYASRVFLVLFGTAVCATIIGYSFIYKKYGVGIKEKRIQQIIKNELRQRGEEC